MQIPPVMAKWIFEEPGNPEFQLSHAIEPLWEQFQPIELRHNHRQGNDRIYGDMLNRIRRGKHTAEDIEQLQAKVTDQLPEGALHLYGLNELVNNHNKEELSKRYIKDYPLLSSPLPSLAKIIQQTNSYSHAMLESN